MLGRPVKPDDDASVARGFSAVIALLDRAIQWLLSRLGWIIRSSWMMTLYRVDDDRVLFSNVIALLDRAIQRLIARFCWIIRSSRTMTEALLDRLVKPDDDASVARGFSAVIALLDRAIQWLRPRLVWIIRSSRTMTGAVGRRCSSGV